jgi:cell division protein FtsB
MQQPVKPVLQSNPSGFTDFFDAVELPEVVQTRQTDHSVSAEVSVSEAAKLLGITERSVWRRIRQKKLSSQLRSGRTVVSVRLSDAPVTRTDTLASTDVDVTDISSRDGHTKHQNVNDRLLDLFEKHALKLEAAAGRIGYLTSQVDGYQDQIKLKLLPDLEAQAAKLLAAQARSEELESELKQLKNGWWYRLRCWFKPDRRTQ